MASLAPAQQLLTPTHHPRGASRRGSGSESWRLRCEDDAARRRGGATPRKGFVGSQTSHFSPD
eukprot:1654837-Pleurochrysis_carterae.AAC.1